MTIGVPVLLAWAVCALAIFGVMAAVFLAWVFVSAALLERREAKEMTLEERRFSAAEDIICDIRSDCLVGGFHPVAVASPKLTAANPMVTVALDSYKNALHLLEDIGRTGTNALPTVEVAALEYPRVSMHFFFESANDAMLFKLTHGGAQ